MRPLAQGDVIRIKRGIPGPTAIVLRTEGESVLARTPLQVGRLTATWYNIREVKRIGRVRESYYSGGQFRGQEGV